MYLYCLSGTVLSPEKRNERLSCCTEELISCIRQTRQPAAKPYSRIAGTRVEGSPLCRRQLTHSQGRGRGRERSPQAALQLNTELKRGQVVVGRGRWLLRQGRPPKRDSTCRDLEIAEESMDHRQSQGEIQSGGSRGWRAMRQKFTWGLTKTRALGFFIPKAREIQRPICILEKSL